MVRLTELLHLLGSVQELLGLLGDVFGEAGEIDKVGVWVVQKVVGHMKLGLFVENVLVDVENGLNRLPISLRDLSSLQDASVDVSELDEHRLLLLQVLASILSVLLQDAELVEDPRVVEHVCLHMLLELLACCSVSVVQVATAGSLELGEGERDALTVVGDPLGTEGLVFTVSGL